tara:strand:+ start:451 stop:855 length:405 start_codon:yes stop_codon:yes gene_type:complete
MFFTKSSDDNHDLNKVAALLIHAAKIDENYTNLEKEIIKKTLLKIGANKENVDDVVNEGEKIEKNSVQILEFTKEVKSLSESNKILIIETLWRIIYSNLEADVYETTLMRRLAGLLYIDNKIMGDIKEKIKKNL